MKRHYGILKRAILISFLCVGLTIHATSCSRKGPDPEKAPVKFGAVLALSGDAANYGKSLRQGLEIARQEINSQGGLGGAPLEIIYEDSAADARTGTNAFRKLADVDHVPVVFGSISGVVLAMAPLAQQSQVVLINSSAISPKICEQAEGYLFNLMVPGRDEAVFAAGYLAREQRGSVGVIFSNNASGKDTKDAFAESVRAAGGTLVFAEGYELTSTDYRPMLSDLKRRNADNIYLIAFSSLEFAEVLRQAREVGLTTNWWTYSGFETAETLSLAGTAAEGVRYSYVDYSGQLDAFDEFVKRYQSLHQGTPDIYTVTSYDALHFLATVMRGGMKSAPEVREALLRSSDFVGILGPVRFGSRQCVRRSLLWKSVEDGMFVALSMPK